MCKVGQRLDQDSRNELIAYNINISPVNPIELFHHCADLDPAIHIVVPVSDDPDISEVVVEYLGYLDLAVNSLKLLGLNRLNILGVILPRCVLHLHLFFV
jgi:hypothetical protein